MLRADILSTTLTSGTFTAIENSLLSLTVVGTCRWTGYDFPVINIDTRNLNQPHWLLAGYSVYHRVASQPTIFMTGPRSRHQRRSIIILHFLADFAFPETTIFKMSLISTRSSPPTAGSARTQSVRQRRGLAAGQSVSQTRLGSSGDSHFHA